MLTAIGYLVIKQDHQSLKWVSWGLCLGGSFFFWFMMYPVKWMAWGYRPHFQPNKAAASWRARSRYQTWVALLYILPTGALLVMILMREGPVHLTETSNDIWCFFGAVGAWLFHGFWAYPLLLRHLSFRQKLSTNQRAGNHADGAAPPDDTSHSGAGGLPSAVKEVHWGWTLTICGVLLCAEAMAVALVAFADNSAARVSLDG